MARRSLQHGSEAEESVVYALATHPQSLTLLTTQDTTYTKHYQYSAQLNGCAQFIWNNEEVSLFMNGWHLSGALSGLH